MRRGTSWVVVVLAVLLVMPGIPVIVSTLTAVGLLDVTLHGETHPATPADRWVACGVAVVFGAVLLVCVASVVRHARQEDRVGVDADGLYVVRGDIRVVLGWDELAAVGLSYDRTRWALELYPAVPDLHRSHPALAGLDRLDGPPARRGLPGVRLLVWLPSELKGRQPFEQAVATLQPRRYLPPAPRNGSVLPPGMYLPPEDFDDFADLDG
jgi:hypothetical protein